MGSLVVMGLANVLLAGVLALAALLAQRYSRRPALVHSLWVLVLVKLITPPLIPLPVPGWHENAPIQEATPTPLKSAVELPSSEWETVPPAVVLRIEDLAANQRPLPPKVPEMPPLAIGNIPVAGAVAFLEEPLAPTPSSPAPRRPIVIDWLAMIGWLWLSGAIVFAAWTLSRLWRFQALLRHARPAPDALQRQAQTLARRLGLRRCPQVWLLPGPVPPMLWAAWGKVRLFFPSSLLAHLKEQGRAALLTHELAHLARRDHWVRWLELLVGCLYWWCPLVWLARHRLQVAEEECCDAWVTNELPDHRSAYAGALLQTVDFLSQVPAALPPAASGFGRVYQLKRRLTMIIRGATPRGLSLWGKLVIFALMLALPMMPSPNRAAAQAKAEAVKADTAVDASDEPTQYQNAPRNFGSGTGGQIWQARVSPDGNTLAVVAGGTGDNEGSLTLFDLPGGKERATVTELKPIRSVAYSPDGKHLATGEFSNVAKLRDPNTGAVTKEFAGHTGAINALVFTPDNKQLITASLDKTLRVWDVASGKVVATLSDHSDWVLGVAISPDGKTLLTTSRDQTARVWDVPGFKTRHVLKGHTNWVESGACSPDNKTVVTFGLDNAVKLWDATSGKLLNDLSGHTNGVLGGIFIDSGKTLLTTSHDRNVMVWDVASGTTQAGIETGHTNSPYAIAASHNSKVIYTGSWDKTIKAWDLDSRESKQTMRVKRYQEDSNFPLLALACSPDGKLLAAAGEEKNVKLLDAATGGLLHTLEGHEDIVSGVAFSTDGKILATAGFDGDVRLWDVASGKCIATLKGHENWVYSVSYSPDGKWLASAGFDKTVRLWDAKTHKHVGTLDIHRGGVRSVGWSFDTKRLVTGGTDKFIRVWDVEKRELLHTIKGHEDAVRGVAFTPDGKRVISGSEDQTVRLWDIAEEKQLAIHRHNNVVRGIALSPRGRSLSVVAQDGFVQILDPTTLTVRVSVAAHTNGGATCVVYSPDARSVYSGGADKLLRKLEAAIDARSAIMTFRDAEPKQQMWVASYSPDGKWLLTAGGDKVVRVRPSMQGTRPWALQGLDSAVYGMAVSPDGEILATGCADGSVKLWNAKTGSKKATLEGHKFQVWMMAYSPDGKRLAVVSGSWQMEGEPGVAKVWDISGMEPKELGDLPTHGSPVMALAWSRDGKYIVTGARDGGARLIDAATLKEKVELKGNSEAARFAVFSPDSKFVAMAGFDGKVRVWSAAEGKEVASFKAHEKGANCVAWSLDGKMLATCSRPGDGITGSGEVKLYDVTLGDTPTFKERATLKRHKEKVLCVAFSPDGKSLASVGGQYNQFGETIIWDTATNKERMLLHGHRMWCEAVTWSKDGSVLYTGGGTSDSRGEVRAWVTSPGGWQVENAHKSEITCAAWSKDGSLVATGCGSAGIKVWEVATGKLKMELTGHKKMIRSLCFAPDGKTLASAASDNMVRLWDLEGQTEAIELAKFKDVVTNVAFSPDGKWLAASSADPLYRVRTGETKVFDVATGKERTGMEWVDQPAMSVAFSPDGKSLAMGGSGANTLKIYNAETGKLTRTIQGANSIRAIVWSPDGKRIAAAHGTGSSRGVGSIQIWDVASGREAMALVGHTSLCLGISYSPDGKRIASASNDGMVKVWELTGPGIPAPTTMTAKAKQ